jgi:site-specific DNA-methyltransferase (adenine-specific)
MVAAALMSSAKHDWRTPESVLARVRRVGAIAFDPCASPDNPTGAAVYCSPPQDGLDLCWTEASAGRLVFVNPPFGRALPRWVGTCAAEASKGNEIVLLTPARPDTSWFRLAWGSARAVCLWSGRMTFKGAPAPAPFPSALWYWGPNRGWFVGAFDDAGIVQVLR